jgi:hypothetical protein
MLQISEDTMTTAVTKMSHNVHPSVMQKAYQTLTYAIWQKLTGNKNDKKTDIGHRR